MSPLGRQRGPGPVKRAIASAITGITQGYSVDLEFRGIGYQAHLHGGGSEVAPKGRVPRGASSRRPGHIGLLGRYLPRVLWGAGLLRRVPRGASSRRRSAAQLKLDIGLSHSASYKIPEDVRIFWGDKGTEFTGARGITVFGISYARTHEVAAEICSYRKREPYKGKGVFVPNTHKAKLFRIKKPASSRS